MSTAALPSSAPSRVPLKVLRAILSLALSLTASLLVSLALLAWVPLPTVRLVLAPFSTANSDLSPASLTLLLIVILFVFLVPGLIFVRGLRRGWLTWPILLGLCALAAGACTYLGWDDSTIRRPLSVDEIAPALPGDEQSFALVMRYAKGSPAANTFVAPPPPIPGSGPRDAEKWKAHLLANRAKIEAGWAELAPLHVWWLELAAQDRIGDLTPPRWDAQIIAFAPFRSYSQHAAAIASLQALDGHGDAALAMLRPLFDVARKLEPNSRTLVRAMVAKVIQRLALETAAFVLDQAPVSAVTRVEFATTLAATQGGPAGARRLLLIEYALFAPLLLTMPLADMNFELTGTPRAATRALGLFDGLIINRRATFNLLGERYYALASLAAERRLDQLEAASAAVNAPFTTRRTMKNFGGRLLADAAMPAFSKVVKSYWEIEDLRAALLGRLKS